MLPEHYELIDHGAVALTLEDGQKLNLASHQYLILDDGLLLITDELAQRTEPTPNPELLAAGAAVAPVVLALLGGDSIAERQPSAREKKAPKVEVPLGMGTTYPAHSSTDVSGPDEVSDHEHLLAYNGKLYFNAETGLDTNSDDDDDEHFYVFDPSAGSTEKVAAVASLGGDNAVHPEYLVEVQGEIFFTGIDDAGGTELMSYDPAANTAEKVASASALKTGGDIDPKYLAPYDNKLYFTANDDGGNKIFVHDPSALTTVAVGNGTDIEAEYLTWLDGKLYFKAEADDGQNELHVYDPETTTTTLVSTIHPSADTGGTGARTDPSYLFAHNGKLYFNGEDSSENEGLYVYDPVAGTTEFIAAVAALNPDDETDPGHFAVYGGKLYFRGELGSESNETMMVYDPITDQAAVVQSVLDLNSDDVEALTVFNGYLYFSLRDTDGNDELYYYDADTLYVI